MSMSQLARLLDPSVIERLNQLQLSARRVVTGTTVGSYRSPVKGASIEFRQHRAYVPGDEPRRLDWRVLARTDRPFVREYDEETNLRCLLLLDRSGSMSYRGKSAVQGLSKFDYAVRLCAAIAHLMLAQTESVGLATTGQRVESWLAPHAGSAQLSRLVDLLERAVADGPGDLGTAIEEAAGRLERRALVIVLSDCFAPAASILRGLTRLRHERHEAIVLRILDRDETDLPFRRWVRFRGLEAESSQLHEPAVMSQTYLDNFNRHAKVLHEACRAKRTELATLSTDRPYISELITFLRRRETGLAARSLAAPTV